MLPTVFAQICLWAFLQKFVYGYTLSDHGQLALFGWLATDYFVAFPCLVLLCALVFSGALARSGLTVRQPKPVLAAGVAAALACPAILFGWGGAGGDVARRATLVVASIALCVSFSIVLFAWLERMRQQVEEMGVRTVLLSALVAYLVYCVIAPSYSNYTPYVLVLEVASLPLASLAYASSARSSEPKPTDACSRLREQPAASTAGKLQAAGAALLFLVFLSASYVDFLNLDLPTEHLEQPTFYALLIFGVVSLAAALAWDDDSQPLTNRRTEAIARIAIAFFAVSFLVVYFYAGSSGRFCFDFTCALRRLVIIVGYVATLGIALAYRMRVDLTVTVGFLAPFLGSRIIMRTLGLQVQAGVMAGTPDERLACMLILGVVGVVGITAIAIAAQRAGAPEALGEPCSSAPVRPSGSVGNPRHADAVKCLADTYGLSERERQILHYLSLGYSVNRMSEMLGISDNTVGTHIRSVYKKTGLHTKQEIIDRVASEAELQRP